MEITSDSVVRAEMPANYKRFLMLNFVITIIAIIIAIIALVQAGDDDPAVDLSGYATKDDLASQSSASTDMSAYASKTYMLQQGYITQVQLQTATANLQTQMSDYATKQELLDAAMGDVDLSDYATKDYVDDTSYSAAAQRNIKLAMVSHGHDEDAYWTNNVKPGFLQAVKDMHVVGIYLNPDMDEFDDPVQMAGDIKSAAYSMVDGIATTLVNPDILSDAVMTALSEPVPVVSYNSGLNDYKNMGAPGSRIATHVGQNEDGAGAQAGAKMASYDGVTSAMCIRHEASNTGLNERCNAFCAKLVELRPDVACSQAAETWAGLTDDDVKASMSSQLENEWKDVNAFLVLGPKYAEIMHELLIDSPNHSFSGDNKTYYGTFDTSPSIFNYIANDQMQFCISQNAYSQGYLPIVFLALNAEIGTMPGAGNPVFTGPNFIDDRTLAGNMVGLDYTDPVNGMIKKREDITIAVVAHGQGLRSSFWAPVYKGVQQAASDLGVKVEYHHSARAINWDAEYDETENLRLIREYGPKVDGMAFSIFNDDLLNALQDQCIDNKLPCVSLNSGMTSTNSRGNSGAFTHVGMDEYQAGSVGGQAFIDRGSQNVFCIMHDDTNSAIRKRCEGARTFNCASNSDLDSSEPSVASGGVTCPNGANSRRYTIVDDLRMASASCNGGSETWRCTEDGESISCPYGDSCCICNDKDMREQIVYKDSNGDFTKALKAYFGAGGPGANADGILTVGGPVAPYLADAIGSSSNNNLLSGSNKKVGVFDCNARVLNEIISGDFSFCLDQQPFLQGYLPVVLLVNAIQWGEKVGGGQPIYSGPAVVGSAEAPNVLYYAEQGLR